jgi:hypothetical protein
VLQPRRRILEGEKFTVPLEVVEGDDWEGLISGKSRTVGVRFFYSTCKAQGHEYICTLALNLAMPSSLSISFIHAETCEAPVSTFEMGKYCSSKTHAVDDACGPGLWGSCTYDESGRMGCLTHVCNGQGVCVFVRARSSRGCAWSDLLGGSAY